mgnify:FL=1
MSIPYVFAIASQTSSDFEKSFELRTGIIPMGMNIDDYYITLICEFMESVGYDSYNNEGYDTFWSHYYFENAGGFGDFAFSIKHFIDNEWKYYTECEYDISDVMKTEICKRLE